MNDLAQDIFDLGVAMNRAHVAQLQEAEKQHRVVYLLWAQGTVLDAVLVGVCGTLARAEQEAADLKRSIRIEARQVHS